MCNPEGWNERDKGFSSKFLTTYKLFFSRKFHILTDLSAEQVPTKDFLKHTSKPVILSVWKDCRA